MIQISFEDRQEWAGRHWVLRTTQSVEIRHFDDLKWTILSGTRLSSCVGYVVLILCSVVELDLHIQLLPSLQGGFIPLIGRMLVAEIDFRWTLTLIIWTLWWILQLEKEIGCLQCRWCHLRHVFTTVYADELVPSAAHVFHCLCRCVGAICGTSYIILGRYSCSCVGCFGMW